MKLENMPYQKQIFVCTNNKEGQGACCADHGGEEIFRQLRQIAKDRGLHPAIRVAQAKCLGKCNMGANIMVYPDGVWYSAVGLDDIKEIADKYLKQGS